MSTCRGWVASNFGIPVIASAVLLLRAATCGCASRTLYTLRMAYVLILRFVVVFRSESGWESNFKENLQKKGSNRRVEDVASKAKRLEKHEISFSERGYASCPLVVDQTPFRPGETQVNF